MAPRRRRSWTPSGGWFFSLTKNWGFSVLPEILRLMDLLPALLAAASIGFLAGLAVGLALGRR